MALRASWSGYLKLSLVTIPVRLYNAISSTSRVSLNQLHKNCNHRVRQQLVCPEHGKLEREDIVKGYEYEEDKYVVIDDADLEKIKLETSKTIDLTQFVTVDEVDPMFFDKSYYVAPDGPMAEDAFRVVREAMRRANKTAIGRVVILGREHIIALRPKEKGFALSTLHYASEIRQAAPYFEGIRNGDVDKDQLALATQLVENNTGPFNPAQFTDRYEEALLQVIKAKVAGSEPVVVQQPEAGKIIDLMSALKQSLAQSSKPQKGVSKPESGSPPAASAAQAEQRPKEKRPRAESVRTIRQSQRKLKAG
jgi:DNA end-binding protein Ku